MDRRWVEFEADPRHRKALMDHFGFEEGAKGAAVNGDKERKEEEEDEDDMEREEAKTFRGLVARMNYVAQDSPDLRYPAKEVSRDMARPKRGAWRRLKKVVKYVAGRRAVVWRYGAKMRRKE